MTMTVINVATVLHVLCTCFHLLPVGAAHIAGLREINANAISDAVSERATETMPRECPAASRTFFTTFSHLDHPIPHVAFACVLLGRDKESRGLPRRRSCRVGVRHVSVQGLP